MGTRLVSVLSLLALTLNATPALAADQADVASPYGNRAEEIDLSEDDYYAPEAVYVTSFAVANDGDSALRGTFLLESAEDEVVSGLGYKIEIRGLGETEGLVYHVHVGQQRFTLAPGEAASHEFRFALPTLPAGTYDARVQVVTAKGRPLGWMDQPIVVKSQRGSFAHLFPGAIRIAEYGDVNLEPLSGPNVSPATDFTLGATASNDGAKTIVAVPVLDVYDFDASVRLVDSIAFDAITLKPGEQLGFDIPVTSADAAGVYSADLRLVTVDGTQTLSSLAQFRWVVRGEDANILTARIASLGTKAGQSTYVTIDTAGAADAETPVTATLQLELRDVDGIAGSIEVPSIALTDAIEMAKARIPLQRDLVGTPSLTARLIGSEGQILDTYSFADAFTAEQLAALNAPTALEDFVAWHGVSRVAVLAMLSLIALYGAAQLALRIRKDGVAFRRVATASFLLVALALNTTTGFAAGNGNGITVKTPAKASTVYGPLGSKPVVALFINKPVHNQPNNLCDKNVPLEYRVEYAVCVNKPSHVRVIGRFALNGGKYDKYEPAGVQWSPLVHNKTYAEDECGTHFCLADDSEFSGTVDLSALQPGKTDTTLQLVAKFGWMETPNTSFSTSDKFIQKGWVHAVNLWLMCSPADLAITKTGSQTVVRGGVASYGVTVTNVGQVAAQNVVVTDPIPSGFTFNAGASDPSCSAQGSNVVCNLGTVNPGVPRTVTIAFNVPSAGDNCQQTNVQNTATVSSSTQDATPNNNTSNTVTTRVDCPIPETGCIEIIKETFDTNGNLLTPVTQFTFQLGNRTTQNNAQGRARFDNVAPGSHTVTEIVPQGWTNTLVTPPNGTVIVAAGPVCSVVNFKNRQNVPNNTNLTIQKTGPSSANRGSTISYGINVHNTGPAVAQNVVVTDNVPQGLVFVPASSDQSCSITGQTVTCNLATMTANQNRTVNLTFSIPTVDTACQPTTVTNVARVQTSTQETSTNDNESSVSTQILCPTPQFGCIEVKKEAFDADNNAITPTPAFTFFLDGAAMAINDGNGRTQFLSVTPGQHTITEQLPGGWTQTGVTPQNGVVNVQAGQTCAQVTFRNRITPTGTDLRVVKTANQSSVVRGSQVSFNVRVDNLGTVAAQNVVITDTVPNTLAFLLGSSDQSCSLNGSTITCNLGTLNAGSQRSVTLAFEFQQTAQECQPYTITNTASVATSTTDTNGANNQSTATVNVTCQQAQFGCIEVLKEGFDANNVRITAPLPEFRFRLDNQQQTIGSDSQGRARFNNVALGTHSVSELPLAGWNLFQITPPNGTVTVQAGDCAVVNFKNRQEPQEGDVTVQKTGPVSVFRGQNITYNVTVANNGPATAQNVSLTDAIPSGLTFVSATSPCALQQNSNTIECSLGAVAQGQPRTITIVLRSAEPTGACTQGSVTNVARVQSSNDGNANNNESSATTQLLCQQTQQHADVQVVKSGPTSAVRGSTLQYQLIVKNNGPVAAPNVFVGDPLPFGTTFVAAQSDNRCQLQGNNVFCNLGTMAVDQQIALQITVQTAAPTSQCVTGTVVNNAAVQSDLFDPNMQNNQSSFTTQLTCPQQQGSDVSIQKTGPSSANRGDTFNYTLNVTNNGPATASGVVVTDQLPSALTFVSATSGCSLTSTNVVTCQVGTLAVGQQRSFVVTVNTPSATQSCVQTTVTNVGTITTTSQDTNSGNNQSSVSTTINCPNVPTESFTITKTDHETEVEPGDTLTYEIRVRNTGNARATNVTVTDELPNDVEFVDASPNADDEDDDEIRWTNETFEPGEEKVYRVEVEVSDDADDGDTLLNRATVRNVSATDTTRVTDEDDEDEDLEIDLTKTASTSEVFPGGIIDYTVRVKNKGDGTIENLVVTDQLPADVIIIDDGDADDRSGRRLEWEIDELEEDDEEIFRYRVSVPTYMVAGQTIRNEVCVEADDLDEECESVTVSVIGIVPTTGARTTSPTSAYLRPIAKKTATSSDGALPLALAIALAGAATGTGLGFGRRFIGL